MLQPSEASPFFESTDLRLIVEDVCLPEDFEVTDDTEDTALEIDEATEE